MVAPAGITSQAPADPAHPRAGRMMAGQAMRGRMFQVTNPQEVECVVADCCSHLMRDDINQAETTAFHAPPS